MAAPPPVRSDEDFERRLSALENARPRFFAWGSLTLASATTCLAISLPNPLL